MSAVDEENLLGWILREPALFNEAKRFGVKPDHFRNLKAQRLWGVFESFAQESKEIELISVTGAFGSGDSSPDDFYPMHLMESAPVSVNVKYVSGKLVEYNARQTYAVELERLAKLTLRTDGPEGWESIKSKISLLLTDILQTNKKSSSDIEYSVGVNQFLEEVEKMIEKGLEGGLWGLPTGLKSLDEAFGGWQESSLYILAARPGVGKTTLAINTADVVSAQGKHVYFCSNEMSANQILGKHHSLLTGISYAKIKSGEMNEQERDKLFKASRDLALRHMTVGEENGRFIETFEAECIAKKREGKLDFVVLDYVQQMEVRDRKIQMRAQELTVITNRLKALSRALKVPILALAQVNRGADEDLPTLANLKDSGSIEQDADAVVFLHNDKQHGYCLSIAKNRFGIQGIRPVKTNLAGNRFFD